MLNYAKFMGHSCLFFFLAKLKLIFMRMLNNKAFSKRT